MMYGVAAFGWTLGVYVLQMLWDNIRVILLSYREYVLWYIFISGLISFIGKMNSIAIFFLQLTKQHQCDFQCVIVGVLLQTNVQEIL